MHESADALSDLIELGRQAERQRPAERTHEQGIDDGVLARVREILDALGLPLQIQEFPDAAVEFGILRCSDGALVQQASDRPALHGKQLRRLAVGRHQRGDLRCGQITRQRRLQRFDTFRDHTRASRN
ncbi:hypothetical protein G6F31_018706 [Rhizopus arrhizus]|nr:hypothetical protein G6F31_018706 [Rhizopus arrhizus]